MPIRTTLWLALVAVLPFACEGDAGDPVDASNSGDSSLTDAASSDAGTEPDVGDSGAEDPLCFCGCVKLESDDPNARCEFSFALLRSAEFEHELSEIKVRTGNVRASYVASSTQCGGALAGFYVDDANAPTKFTLCPAVCDRFRMTGNALFGVDCGDPL